MRFKNITALDRICLEIEKGDFTFITGPSGAGKTTLLNLLAGEIIHSSGSLCREVLVQEKLFIARVFQNLQLIHDWQVKQNLELCYNKEIFKSRKEFDTELADLANLFDIKNKLHEKVRNLNGGGKQKVAIVRALLCRPDIFIADEPTSSLDKENAKRLYEVLNFYNQKMGMSVLWATHQIDLINQFHGKLIHLNKGKVVRSY